MHRLSMQILQIILLRLVLLVFASGLAISGSIPGSIFAQQTSFENDGAGVVSELTNEVGTWRVITGTATIDDKHANSGRQCLQLNGGDETVVELTLNGDCDSSRCTPNAGPSEHPSSFEFMQWRETNGQKSTMVTNVSW